MGWPTAWPKIERCYRLQCVCGMYFQPARATKRYPPALVGHDPTVPHHHNRILKARERRRAVRLFRYGYDVASLSIALDTKTTAIDEALREALS